MMKSKQWLMFFGLLIALILFVGNVQAKGDYAAVVVATGDDAATCQRPDLPGVFVTQDVCNIQAAVNANPGGKILLRGTFHFAEYGDDGYVVPGTDGTVFITNDVEIKGEKLGSHSLTRIKGGYFTFSIGYQPLEWTYNFFDELLSLPDNAAPVNVTIKDIQFENALYMPIRIWATTGSTIKGNKVIDGRSLSTEDILGPGDHGTGFGIAAAPPGAFIADNKHLVTGRIDIVDNFVDGMYRRADAGDPWGAPSYGIPIRGLAQDGIAVIQLDADVTIEGNTVYDVGLAGILDGSNVGTTKIKDNIVHMVFSDSEIAPYFSGIITWGWYFGDAYGTAEYVIKDNDVIVGGGLETVGIHVDWTENAPIVQDNKVSLDSPAGAGILLSEVSNARVTGNEIEGSGQYGLVLGHWFPWPYVNNENKLKDNELEDFNASTADYYLGEGVTNNILYLGGEDTVLNESGNDTNIVIFDG